MLCTKYVSSRALACEHAPQLEKAREAQGRPSRAKLITEVIFNKRGNIELDFGEQVDSNYTEKSKATVA